MTPTPPTRDEMAAWLRKRAAIYVSESDRESGIVLKFRSVKGVAHKLIPYESIESAYRRLYGVIP